MSPTQHKATIKSNRRAGSYQHIVLQAPGLAEGVRPGHFASVAVGGRDSAMVTRRAFSIHRANVSTAHELQTLELVISANGGGSSWLAQQQLGAIIDVISPLGKPFALPLQPVSCLLVAGGYGSAPMVYLAEELTARGCEVDMIYGAATEAKLFGVLEAKRIARFFQVTTDDGSAGVQGRVTDVMPELIRKAETSVVYSCGPMAMLRQVAKVAERHGLVSQVAVEEQMACGVGVCMTCVLPIIGEDGQTRMIRACTDGPVFRGNRVRWDALGTVPADCLGAPQAGDH